MGLQTPIWSIFCVDGTYGFVIFGAGPESGTGQIFDMSQLTANATIQPKITSLTRRSPLCTPPILECVGRLPAMTAM